MESTINFQRWIEKPVHQVDLFRMATKYNNLVALPIKGGEGVKFTLHPEFDRRIPTSPQHFSFLQTNI
jgi:hypothetical protein